MAKSLTSRAKPKARAKPVTKKAKAPERTKSSRAAKKSRVSYKDDSEDEGSSSDEEDDASFDAYEDEDEVEVEEEAVSEEVDSDDLDDSDDGNKRKRKKSKGKKGDSPAKSSSKGSSPAKNGVTRAVKLVKGPRNDEQVEAGLIAPFTMEFLADLAKPENNEREWLALNDARYRASLANWHDFVNAVVPKFTEADWTIPTLPSKDLVYRIYRDIRFSQDKTPYKTNMSASFSRTGRKGPWAGYYLQIKPGGGSLIAGGKWHPEKNDLATIRHAILRNPKRIRKIIGAPDFVNSFGPPRVGTSKNPRQNIFGHEDMLKNCPKMDGVTKDHKEIDLLKLRTIAAVKYFPDDIVLSDKFIDEIGKVAKILAPLVQLLNDLILPQSDDEAEEDEEDEGNGVNSENGEEEEDGEEEGNGEEEGDGEEEEEDE